MIVKHTIEGALVTPIKEMANKLWVKLEWRVLLSV
jgi:hypothetical protein